MILIFRKIYSRLHFYLGNIYRFLTVIKFQKKILVNEACTIFGASFGEDGWHHIIKTLEEYDADPQINYKKTSLYRFLKNFTPKSICDLTDNKINKCSLPLFVYPWGTFKKNEYTSFKDPSKSRFCGPSEDEFIKDEFKRTISLYKKIKKIGYRPWLYGNTFVGGVFLINQKGDRRFVVLQGNHRMAILAHLNYASINVREVKGYLVKILESNCENWFLVKSGKCHPHVAKTIFSLFFKENGRHINKFLEN
jgi:hypothetical protein